MKNIIKYIALPSLAIIVFLLVAVNYGQRLRFGDAYFENDTANKILTNKSLYFESGDSIYYNNVVVTSGSSSGIAASDNITFTGRDSTTELWRFGDSVRFYDHVLFKDTVKVSNAIMIVDSVRLLKNLLLGTTSKIFTNVNTLYQMESAYEWQTTYASGLLNLDSLNGMNLHYGVYTGNGSGLTSVDAITLKGQDTSKFARTDTLITEDIKGKWNFWNVVRCIGVVTFDVSPIFNSLVNFANGINVTGTATFDGDIVSNGWTEQGGAIARDKYFRDTVLRFVCTTVPFTAVVAHGIPSNKQILFINATVRDDSSGLVFNCGASASGLFSAALGPPTGAWADATNANVRFSASLTLLDDNVDTVKFYIRYTDYQR